MGEVYRAEEAGTLLAERRFVEVLPGFVSDHEGVPLILDRLAGIARAGKSHGLGFQPSHDLTGTVSSHTE
jgi:hypothetical protein